MTTSEELLTQASLALASYAVLPSSLTESGYIDALRSGDMTLAQATAFAATYSVVTQYNHSEELPLYDDGGNLTGYTTLSNGLSVTVFEKLDAAGMPTGEKYLAIRGTNDGTDIATDIVDIALLGTTAIQTQYAELKAKVTEWLTNGTLSPSFTVTGHSLGGFLATGLAADFASNVSHTYLYNSPGIGGIAAELSPLAKLLETMGVAAPGLDPSKISNIKADAGVSLIAGFGYEVSPSIWIPIEDQHGLDITSPPGS